MRLEAIRSIIPISCRRYPKSVWNVFFRQLLYRSEDRVRATSTKCRMKREMVHQMSSDILGYMSHHRSKYSWENGWFRCTDNRTIYTLDWGSSRLQMTMWSQIAPWLKIFLQKEWVSQILLLSLPCHIRFLLVWFCNTKISENSDMTKSWAARLCRLPKQKLVVAQDIIKVKIYSVAELR